MKKYKGFTLIELILVMIVLGIGLSGVLSIMIVSVQNSVTPELRWQVIVVGETIVQTLLEQKEIESKQGSLDNLFPLLAKQIPNAKNISLSISTKPLAMDESVLVNVKLTHQAIGETQFSAIKGKQK